MKAAVLHASGEAPRYESFADPVAGEREAIVTVRAASIKQLDRQMVRGSHYASYRTFPVIPGTDGAGTLPDGRRVFFGVTRAPYGGMAERTVVNPAHCFPLPDNVSDEIASAVFNPGLSAYGSLVWRAELAAGESVLVLGATGVTGMMAVQTAKLLGAKRVVAVGRNAATLETLRELGADSIIQFDQPGPALTEAFVSESGESGFDVILDYLWGAPTESLLAAITRQDLHVASKRVRLVEVGETAGATITLPGGVLRSSRLEILGAGTGSAAASADVWINAVRLLLANVASGKLRIQIERVPLADVATTWLHDQAGTRTVLIP